MASQNPTINDADAGLPARPFKVTFLPMDVTVEVKPEELPYGNHGLPGSILDIAMKHGIDVDHACGGVCACATCHVVVKQGGDSCNPSTDDEEDQLDDAYGVTPQSRLACQCVPAGSQDLVVVVPQWNRNQARDQAPPGPAMGL